MRSWLALVVAAAACGPGTTTSSTGAIEVELVERGRVPFGNGIEIVRFARVVDGIEIDGSELRALEQRSRRLASRMPRMPALAIREADWTIADEATAIARAVGGSRDATARRVWWRAGHELVAAWRVEAYLANGDLRRAVIAARDGRVLASRSLVDHGFAYRVYAHADRQPFDAPVADSTPHVSGMPDETYPPFAPPSLVVVESGLNTHGDPWLPADAVETIGNHAHAYVDLFEPDGYQPDLGDFRARAVDGTFGATFDPATDATATREQSEAAIQHAFYTVNWLHDFWYDAGFTEAAGNAQALNYGRGGVEGDAMRVEVQDTALDGTRNNANMATPSDGMSPRMQLYVFRGIETRRLSVAPDDRELVVGSATFGQREHDVTAPLAVPSPADACTPITNDLAGKIALVQAVAGGCAYELAVQAVQDAGAVGALVIHHLPTDVPPQLGDDPAIETAIDLPVFSVTMADGATLADGTVVRMARSFTPEPDSAVDTTVIAHEYGHYVHRRLADCGSKLCSAISEGWGDFIALLVGSREGDDLDGAYPVAAYAAQAFSNDPAYYGIRRLPYSSDRAIDGLTYRHMADGESLPPNPISPTNSPNSEVHNAGEVWATVLWDAYIALQKAHPGDFAATRRRMAQIVVGGLLLTPPDATPTEARDALLQMAAALSPADAETLLAAFTARGFGSCAKSPLRTSGDFIGIAESYEIKGAAEATVMTLDDSVASCDADGILDADERGRIVAPIANRGHLPLENLSVALVSLDGGPTIASEPVAIARLEPGESIDVAFEVALGRVGELPVAGGLALEITAPGGCVELVRLETRFRMNADDRAAAATVDKFDAPSVWTAVQSPEAPAWTHQRQLSFLGVYEGFWAGSDLSTITDTALESPPLDASDTEPLVIELAHRHDFEFSDGIAWDGGVIEISVDGGATWRDVAELGSDPGYTHVLSDAASNPLSNRRAFSGRSPAYPAYDSLRLDLGMALAGQTFQIRFRIGTDEATGARGWDLENFAITSGVVGTPFPSQELDAGPCDTVDDGGCCSASSSSSAWLAAVVLVGLRRRRAALCRASRRSREPRRRRA